MKKLFTCISVVIILVTGLNGCAQLIFPKRDNLINLKTNTNSISGIYKNMPSDSSEVTLWYLLSHQDGDDTLYTTNAENLSVQLIVQNQYSLIAKLFDENSLIAQKKVNGKIQGDYFSVRRKIKYIGLPLIYMKESDWKLQIAKTKNGNLHIDGAFFSVKNIFIISGGFDYTVNCLYAPK